MRNLVAAFGVISVLITFTLVTPAEGSTSSQPTSESSTLAPADIPDRNQCGSASIPNVQTNLTGGPADELERLSAKYAAVEGFRAVVYDGNESILVVDPATVDEWTNRGSEIRVAPSCVPENLMTAAKEAIRDMAVGEGHFAFAGYDGLRDVVFAESSKRVEDLRQAIHASLLRRGDDGTGVARATEEGSLRLRQREPGAIRLANRGSDFAPFFGGGKIRVAVPAGRADCSTGFYINSATNGTVMVTAGHCSDANGADVDNGNLTSDLGAIEGRRFPDPDLALIDGAQYAATSFAWNDQTTAKPIASSFEPITGAAYCQFGYVSLRKCGSYISMDVSFNLGGGVTNHLALMSSPSGPGQSLGAPGDSGAGVFRELSGNTISARGTVVGGFCDVEGCFRFDHKLSTIKNTYVATVVTQ